jgi:putative FmdB family regulatory protein
MDYKEVIMPAYEYECKDCHRDFTIYLSIKEFEEKPEIKCPHCDSNNVHKKISGFYAKTSSKS